MPKCKKLSSGRIQGALSKTRFEDVDSQGINEGKVWIEGIAAFKTGNKRRYETMTSLGFAYVHFTLKKQLFVFIC